VSAHSPIHRERGFKRKSLRDRLYQKLARLSTEQLNSVWQFVEFLEYQQTPIERESPTCF
jgi:hypothetical protein